MAVTPIQVSAKSATLGELSMLRREFLIAAKNQRVIDLLGRYRRVVPSNIFAQGSNILPVSQIGRSCRE